METGTRDSKRRWGYEEEDADILFARDFFTFLWQRALRSKLEGSQEDEKLRLIGSESMSKTYELREVESVPPSVTT